MITGSCYPDHRTCLLLARNRHADAVAACLLLRRERTWLGRRRLPKMTPNGRSEKRTSTSISCRPVLVIPKRAAQADFSGCPVGDDHGELLVVEAMDRSLSSC
jgi:hypothetical protein